MKQYIGVKVINAKPMTRAEYNVFRGWQLPADENGDDAGFLVEYTDGGRGNTDHYAGYVSWSPADVFDRAYRVTTGMTFGLSVEALKLGHKVARAGWNGKGMWLSLVNNWNGNTGSLPADHKLLAWIGMKTADNGFVPWLASQTDMLSEDWEVVA
jgi:hypothetical protein